MSAFLWQIASETFTIMAVCFVAAVALVAVGVAGRALRGSRLGEILYGLDKPMYVPWLYRDDATDQPDIATLNIRPTSPRELAWRTRWRFARRFR